ncbi:signal transduction histidine kinase [Streptomyces griseochromogenes]|uniref:histidine kinase n=1 Tax=Streptomyces griseochromogenes TaxID=68214 RepID=A0A1B1B3L2_9ACTN|nr:HAMP domain-containing sensor histidine kinase [Streptomyces griseochromogenes]ANP53416.1 two-component sensor histidine kinase [Streptomyces griseochromogenes]MBP2055113.1 signal transduction histidine kinase [Streptomyces griseochromogenes]
MTRRLLLSYLSLTLLVLLCLEVPFGYVYARGEMSRFTGNGQQAAGMLAEVLEEKVERRVAADVPEVVASFARRTGSHVIVVDDKGRLLTDSRNDMATGTDLSAQPDIATALANGSRSRTRQDPALGEDVFLATVPGASGSTVRCVVRASFPLTAVTSKVHDAWLALAAVGLGVLAAVALIALALARWITGPVRALEHATTQLADGTLKDLPATDLGPPELRRLASSFVRTATRLQHLLKAQHAFASEASHQLKTPLTALRLRLENFEPYLDPRAQPSLDEAVGEVERLSRMVHGLLALARLENAATTAEATDLDSFVADRAAVWTAFAGEHYVDIVVAGPRIGRVWTIPGALDQIIDNLLSNALRVSPPDTTITLATAWASGVPGTVELHVIDQGPGMTEDQRRRAFDRFWRANDADHEGTGLGLPIVRQLARASGGEVTLRAAPGGGLDAVVRLRTADTHRAAHPRRPRPTMRARQGAVPPVPTERPYAVSDWQQ